MSRATTRDRPPHRGGTNTGAHIHAHTYRGQPLKCETMGDGGIQPRGTWTSVGVVVRMIGSLLGHLAVTDISKDNTAPRLATRACGKYPEGISPSQSWGLQRKAHRSAALRGYPLWGSQPQTGSHRGTGVTGTGSAAGQHSTGGCGSSVVRQCGSALRRVGHSSCGLAPAPLLLSTPYSAASSPARPAAAYPAASLELRRLQRAPAAACSTCCSYTRSSTHSAATPLRRLLVLLPLLPALMLPLPRPPLPCELAA